MIQINQDVEKGTALYLDLGNNTVVSEDQSGEQHDLNAHGEPCKNLLELREFVSSLHEVGFFNEQVRAVAMEEIDAELTSRENENYMATMEG